MSNTKPFEPSSELLAAQAAADAAWRKYTETLHQQQAEWYPLYRAARDLEHRERALWQLRQEGVIP